MSKVRKKNESEKQLIKRREMKKLSMRRARDRLKQENAEKCEEIKKKDREHKKATRKKVVDMTDRERRQIQKEWRERARRCREKKKILEEREKNLDTPPNSPQFDQAIGDRSSTSRIDSGQKRRRRNRILILKELKKAKEECKKLKTKVSKYKQKYYREKSKMNVTDTPTKEVKSLLKGQSVSPEIMTHLKFGTVLSKQIKTNFQEEGSKKKRILLSRLVSGKIIKKYRFQQRLWSLTSRSSNPKKIPCISREKILQEKTDVMMFLERDVNSRMCAGKKDTITRRKVKKQKRLLCDSLLSLHKKFISEFLQYQKMSYTKFCRYRPFWILQPTCKDRDTCLCFEHANFELLVTKVNAVGMIDAKSPKDVMAQLTCSNEGTTKEVCLERQCRECILKSLKWKEFENETVSYYQWFSKKVQINIKGTEKCVKKTIKEEVKSSKRDLVSKIEHQAIPFMKHIVNIQHQYRVTSNIKKTLKDGEVFIHMDFSENYSCKYSEEVQSVHFGGSRNQITLHTVVVYYTKNDKTVTKSMCTFSESPKHDAVAICAHLEPILAEIKLEVANVRTVHFQSDGPSTQYRNKTMFYLAATFLTYELQVGSLHWHYSEKGHGKGAPDGVGGCVKRSADRLVAQGVDIPDIQTMVHEIGNNLSNVKIFVIDAKRIEEIGKLLPDHIPVFKGTLHVHEITWSAEAKYIMQARRLSCEECEASTSCNHYSIGQININYRGKESTKRIPYSEVYSSDTEDSDDASVTSNPEEKSLHRIATANDYVLIKCCGKKTIAHYIGFIESYSKTEKDYKVKFLKRSGKNRFVFSESDRLYDVDPGEICTILNQPTLNHRKEYLFDFDFSRYANVC